MQAFQRTIESIAAHIRGLTPTARLLVGSLMIILIMSLYLVSLYTGRTELSPLGLKPGVSASVKAQVMEFLEARQIPHEDRGGDVFVASNQKIEVLGQLADSQLIEGDQINFDTLISDSSPFRTRDENRQRYLVAKMNVLSGMIGQMAGIQRAKVVIDAPEHTGGIGRPSIPASASVSVQTRSGELGQAQVDAIAHLIARSHAGLKPENVAVIDAGSGRALRARDDQMISSSRYLEVKQAAERHAKTAIAGALHFIPGVLIEVNAQVDATDEVKQTASYDEPRMGVTSESSHTLTTTPPTPPSDVAPALGRGASMADGLAGAQTVDERIESSSVAAFGRSESQVRDPKGYPLQINAAIGVPRSYFIRLLQDQSPSANAGAAPDDLAALDALVQAESQRLREYIKPLIDTQAIDGSTTGTISVTMVHDFAQPVHAELESPAGAASLLAGRMNGEVLKSVGLGGLAMLSVAMMFLLVRRASTKPRVHSPGERAGLSPVMAMAATDLVGEADEAAPVLEGVELSEEAVRRQQMLAQITYMVNQMPEDAAGLLRQWVRTDA